MTARKSKIIKCPTCKKPVEKAGNDFFPFCSERCQLIDLGKWFDDKYKIEGSDSASEPEPSE